MNRAGIEARARFVAALITAIAGSVHAEAAEEIGGDEAAAQLEATVTEAREAGIVKTAAALLAAFAVFRCVPDGKYRRALVLGAIATGTAVAGHIRQRRDVRPWQ